MTTLDSLPPPPMPEERACEDDMEMWTFPMSEEGYGAASALIRIEGVLCGGGGTMVYYSCEDCAVEAARAAGSIFREKMSIGAHGYVAIVNRKTAVGWPPGCVPRGDWQGITRRNSRSILRRYNAAMRRAKRAVRRVA